MRVRLIGTGSADGWPNPFCACASCSAERGAGRSRQPSSALVDGRILIDCGPTTPHPAAGSGITLQQVEHVLVTHGHPDHLHPAFLLSRRWTGPDRPLHVWGPRLAIDMCRDWIGPGSAVELHVVTPGARLVLHTTAGIYDVAAHAARHAHGDGDEVAAEALLYSVTAPDGARLLYATDTGPFDPAEAGVPGTPFDVVLLDETFGDTVDHGTGHLDLATLPAVLARLRDHGAIAAHTTVGVTHLSHHNPPAEQLRPRLAALGVRLPADREVIDTCDSTATAHRHLLLGGARSGKSALAERLLADRKSVAYVATGGERADDAEWVARVQAHRDRRPAAWTTVETLDIAGVLDGAEPGSAVLVDCLALWLTGTLDALDAWQRAEDGDRACVQQDVLARIESLVGAVGRSRVDVVLVSNEVGMGVVPTTSSGRLFRDLLGVLNMRMAQACDETTLVVAGRALALTDPRSPHA